MKDYVVTITSGDGKEVLVGCIVSSGYDPRSAWGRYKFFAQMSRDAGQTTTHIGKRGEKTTVADAADDIA